MTQHDHADPSVRQEPAPPYGHDHPHLTPDWAPNITLEIIDLTCQEYARQMDEFDTCRSTIWLGKSNRRRSDIAWAIHILWMMCQRGLAPPKAWVSWHCIQSLIITDWIINRIVENGFQLDRYKGAK